MDAKTWLLVIFSVIAVNYYIQWWFTKKKPNQIVVYLTLEEIFKTDDITTCQEHLIPDLLNSFTEFTLGIICPKQRKWKPCYQFTSTQGSCRIVMRHRLRSHSWIYKDPIVSDSFKIHFNAILNELRHLGELRVLIPQ